MPAPLARYWVVEYCFYGDCFHVSELPDYLSATQNAFLEQRLYEGVVLAIHPTEQGARDECSVWEERRSRSALTDAGRITALRARLRELEAQQAEPRDDPLPPAGEGHPRKE